MPTLIEGRQQIVGVEIEVHGERQQDIQVEVVVADDDAVVQLPEAAVLPGMLERLGEQRGSRVVGLGKVLQHVAQVTRVRPQHVGHQRLQPRVEVTRQVRETDEGERRRRRPGFVRGEGLLRGRARGSGRLAGRRRWRLLRGLGRRRRRGLGGGRILACQLRGGAAGASRDGQRGSRGLRRQLRRGTRGGNRHRRGGADGGRFLRRALARSRPAVILAVPTQRCDPGPRHALAPQSSRRLPLPGERKLQIAGAPDAPAVDHDSRLGPDSEALGGLGGHRQRGLGGLRGERKLKLPGLKAQQAGELRQPLGHAQLGCQADPFVHVPEAAPLLSHDEHTSQTLGVGIAGAGQRQIQQLQVLGRVELREQRSVQSAPHEAGGVPEAEHPQRGVPGATSGSDALPRPQRPRVGVGQRAPPACAADAALGEDQADQGGREQPAGGASAPRAHRAALGSRRCSQPRTAEPSSGRRAGAGSVARESSRKPWSAPSSQASVAWDPRRPATALSRSGWASSSRVPDTKSMGRRTTYSCTSRSCSGSPAGCSG